MFPYLFRIGDFELRVYSLAIMAAVFIALFFIVRRSVALKLDEKKVENLVIVTFLCGILGARLYYVIFQWEYFSEHLSEIPAVWHGGLAIHGGIILGAIAALIYCRKMKLNFPEMADLVAPFVLLGQGIGRFGNFANGEAHGFSTITPPDIIFRIKPIFGKFWSEVLLQNGLSNTPHDMGLLYEKVKTASATVLFEGKEYILQEYVPWGVSFPAKYMSQAYQEFGMLPVHPTFFYEMILNFIGASILFMLWKDNKNIGTGKIFGLYIIFYAVIRGFVTFFRADDLMFGFLRAPHVASLFLLVVAIFWYKYIVKLFSK